MSAVKLTMELRCKSHNENAEGLTTEGTESTEGFGSRQEAEGRSGV